MYVDNFILISFCYCFPRVTNVKIDDNLMHHISVTWENCEGNWQLFVDGKLAERGTGFMKDHVIPHGGTAVIGNDQDKMGGGFEMRDAFGPGEVVALNMWSTVLSACEISKQSKSCNIPQGSVLGLQQFN